LRYCYPIGTLELAAK
jgi:YD repeat-containing protein